MLILDVLNTFTGWGLRDLHGPWLTHELLCVGGSASSEGSVRSAGSVKCRCINLFKAVRSAWSLWLHLRAGWDDLNGMWAWCGGSAWIIRLSTLYTLQLLIVCLERQVCSVLFPLVCQVGSGWSQWHFKRLARRGFVWLQFSYMCTWVESVWSVQSVQFGKRDKVWTMCMICTYLSVGVIDLQDLYDLYTGMGYVRSAWHAHFHWWVCMICGIFVWSGGSAKSGCFTLVCIMFSREGSAWGGYFTNVYTWVGSVSSVHLYRVGSVSSTGVESVCDLYILTGMRSVRFAGYVWSAGFMYDPGDL